DVVRRQDSLERVVEIQLASGGCEPPAWGAVWRPCPNRPVHTPRPPAGAAPDLRPTIVQQTQPAVRPLRVTVVQSQTSRLLEVADDCRLDALARAQLVQLGPISRRHRQDHPLLRL